MIYELLWIRELSLVMGRTTYAVSTVIAAFMGGLALGSYFVGRKAAGVASPIRAYGLLEIGIALAALLVQPASSQRSFQQVYRRAPISSGVHQTARVLFEFFKNFQIGKTLDQV